MPARKKLLYILFPILLFGTVISFNFSKPFGFFRETNPAMVCINAILWQQFPDMQAQNIPLVSYAFEEEKAPQTQLYNTSTTFGFAWFSVPYYFFKIFNLQPGPISMRFFSLCWLLFTVLTMYLLIRQLTIYNINAAVIKYFTLLLYIFSPVVLWYHVQGYVHEIAVLPFYFLSWLFFARFLNKPQSTIQLLACCLFLLASVQFDWLPVFQAICMSFFLWLKRKDLHTHLSFSLPVLFVLLGVGYIVYTYQAWIGWSEYVSFLKSKFLNRTVGGGGLQIFPWLNFNLNILVFYATGFGLTAMLFLFGLFKKQGTNVVIILMISAALLHQIIFWGFSTEHDHGVAKMALPIAFISAIFIAQLQVTKRWIITISILVINLGIYFYLHNFYRRPGMYQDANFCYSVGNFAKTNLPATANLVFINTEGKHFPQIEYYAGRAYILADSYKEATFIFQKYFSGKTGYFIEIENGEIQMPIKLE